MSNLSKPYQVFAYILEYKARHDGNSPTYREILTACNISTLSLVHAYLVNLEAEGLIRRPQKRPGNRSACNIEVIGGRWEYSVLRLDQPPTSRDFRELSNAIASAHLLSFKV